MNSPIHIVTVIAILHCENKYLLVKRNGNESVYPNKWQNLGGKVEDAEIIEDALQREIQEEIGIHISEKPIYLQSYSWHMVPHEANRLGLIFFFQLQGKQQDFQVTLSEELSDYGWFTHEEVANLDAVGEKTARAGTYGQIREAEKYLASFSK